MTHIEFIKKYPDTESFTKNIIDLHNIAYFVNIIMKLKQDNDYETIKQLGLNDFLSDMRKVFGTSKDYIISKRENKLKRILKENN